MASTEISHPVFARLFTWFSSVMEREIGPWRQRLLEGLSGRVLEVGAGNGMNFPHYGPEVDEVVALEPEPYLRSKASVAASSAAPEVTIVDGNATSLPFEDAGFDAVVFCLVLCSIDDPARALAEAGRVLKPGGEVRFLEHVGSSKPHKARIQRLLDRSRIWPTVAGGCNCSRDTVAEIEGTGFDVPELSSMAVGPEWAHTNPHVIGRARPHTPA